MTAATDLLLIPTQKERELIEQHLPGSDRLVVELCGFGLVAAAARSAQLLARHAPRRVLLLGIAGTYTPKTICVGHAYCFAGVHCDGIGIGTGKDHSSAGEIGWLQWDGEDKIAQSLRLVGAENPEQQLLSVCAASATMDDAEQRRLRYPKTCAEDMEGFGVAVAATLANSPLTIIRGISNVAGDRSHSNWQVEDAAIAAALKAREWLAS